MSLKGSVALVTGGGSGIGLETVLVFADLGADVAIVDRTPGAAERAAEQVRTIGGRAIAIEGDVADVDTIVGAFAETKRVLGDVRIAVACAGILGEGGPVHETSVEDFDQVLDVNVRGSFLVVREAARQMRPHRRDPTLRTLKEHHIDRHSPK